MSAQSPAAMESEGRVLILTPRSAKAKSLIATVEHKRRDQVAAGDRVDLDDANGVFRHALRAHAANMAVHVDMIAGVGPTQRQLPRKSAARVQYEDAAAAAAVDEYELEEGEEEGEQQEVTAITRPRVPALQLPGAAAVTAARGDTATWASAREPSAAASPRRHAASSPHAVAAAVAANVSAGSVSSNFDDTDGADPPLHLPRTEQLLLALKRYTGGPSSPGAAHGSQRSVCLSEQQSPLPSPRQAPGDGRSDYRGAYAAAGGVTAPPLSPRSMTSPSGLPGTDTGAKRGSQYGATVPPTGYPSMPPSATATNVVSRSLTPRQMQQALAAMAGAGGGGADADAAALAPTRSAASFTAAVGGCRRPSLTQLFPEGGVGGQAGGAVAAGDTDGIGYAAVQCGTSHSFSGPTLRRPAQRRGSMVLLPSSGAGGLNPASQALRPTIARNNMARLTRRSDTSGELQQYPYAAVPIDTDAAFAVGTSVPASPVSPVKTPAAAGASGSVGAHRGLRAAAEALFSKVSRSPARGAAAGAQEWYFASDAAPGQPPLSPSALRFASASGGGAGAASPFATAAAGASVYVARTGSSGLASPIANTGTSSAANLFAGMTTAAGGANGAPSSGGGGSAGGSATTSLRARVAPPSPLQVAATQSGEAWFVERTASAMQQASASAAPSSGRRLPTPSALSAAPAVGRGSFTSSAAVSPGGSSAMPRLLPSLLQPPSASVAICPSPPARAPEAPGGVASFAATATAATTATAGPAATAADSSDASCVCAPLQVLQPTPPPPTAVRRGRVRASASCYLTAAGDAAAEAYAHAAFAQKPRSLGTNSNSAPLQASMKPPQPLPLMPSTPATSSAQPAAHLPSAASSASYDGGPPSSLAAAAAASGLMGVSPTAEQPPSLLPHTAHDGEAFAFQHQPVAASTAAAAIDVVRAPPPSQGSSGLHATGRTAAAGAFAAPPPPVRAHAMTSAPGDTSFAGSDGGSSSCSFPQPVPTPSPTGAAADAAPPAEAAEGTPVVSAAAHASVDDITSSVSNCAEVLESLSCWAGAFNDAASASDRVFGSMHGVQSFGRTAWVARSREESLGWPRAAAAGAAVLQLPVACQRADAEEEEVIKGGEKVEAGLVSSGAAHKAPADAGAGQGGAGTVPAPVATAAGNTSSGIMSRMKRALLSGAAAGAGSS